MGQSYCLALRQMKLNKRWGLIPEASWGGCSNLLYLLVGKGVKRQVGGGPKCWYENELQQVVWADRRAPKSNTAHWALLPPVPRR